MATESKKVERQFKTPLGTIRCGFTCGGIDANSRSLKYENGNSEIFETDGHKIELILFKLRTALRNSEMLIDTGGWILRIEKVNEIPEKIKTYCLLDKNSEEVTIDADPGEYLDAVRAGNDEWVLHIGTEDGDILNSRAVNDDWFPVRLKAETDCFQTITEMRPDGFVTNIPELKSGEKIHIQYLAAYDKMDEEKVNTWLAVDEMKRNLEKWIGI